MVQKPSFSEELTLGDGAQVGKTQLMVRPRGGLQCRQGLTWQVDASCGQIRCPVGAVHGIGHAGSLGAIEVRSLELDPDPVTCAQLGAGAKWEKCNGKSKRDKS